MSTRPIISWGEMVRIFCGTGARSFGGWAATALLLEKELVDERKVLTKTQLHGAVAYAQILPGATQVAIVSNAGYKLRGVSGAGLATFCYLLPALTLITMFAALYFHYASGPRLMAHLGGLIAALGGVILANAIQIGKRHAVTPILWLASALALVLKFWLGVNAVLIILGFGAIGLGYSLLQARRQTS